MATNISNDERNLFDILRKDKLEDSRTFSKSSNRGLWKTIIEQYPESAHFIYELLQNANDAKATYVKIILSKKGIVFKHNGTIQFSITSLDAKPVGHINAITSIGDSSKDGLNTIGKFGIGFKSVFTYTDTPEVYDDKFWFRIENYIVPTLLNDDHHLREDGETLFWLPFRANEEEQSYKEIYKKVRGLDNPILFLDSLELVEWKDLTTNNTSIYSKNIDESCVINEIDCERIGIQNGKKKNSIWMFHRKVKIDGINKLHRISVGYYLKEKDEGYVIDTTCDPKVFCFFPTSVKFHQKRVMHAPFLLTASRSELLEDNEHNEFLIEELAKLSADSLVCLRDIGLKNKKTLVNDNLLDLVHIPDFFYDAHPEFTQEYIRVIKGNNLLITKEGEYTSVANARIAQPIKLLDVVSDEQLTMLLKSKTQMYFVFSSVTQRDFNKQRYITTRLNIPTFDTKALAVHITAEFMRGQDVGWLHKFYAFVKNEARDLWNSESNNALFRYASIIRTNKGEFVAPYIKNNLNVFLSSTNVETDKNTIDNSLLENKATKIFFNELGIREINLIDQIALIGGKHESQNDIDDEIFDDIRFVISTYIKATSQERKDIVDKVKGKLKVHAVEDGRDCIERINNVYVESNVLNAYFRNNDSDWVYIFDGKHYQSLFEEYGEKRVMDALFDFGLQQYPIIKRVRASLSSLPQPIVNCVRSHYSTRGYTINDTQMQGLEYALKNNLSKEVSIAIWEWLSKAVSNGVDWNKLHYDYFYRTAYTGTTESSILYFLKNTKWIYGTDNKRGIPSEFTREQLRKSGYCDNEYLFDILSVKATWEDSDEIPIDVKEMARLGEKIKQLGIPEEEAFNILNQYAEKLLRKSKKTSCDDIDNITTSAPLREADADEMFAKNSGDRKQQQQPSAPTKTTSKSSANLEERMNKFLEFQEKEREQEQYIENLRDIVEKSPQYSKEWFEALLELEYKSSKEDITAVTSKAISISFQRVEKERGSDRIFVLKNPAKPIPLGIEEVGGITVKFQFSNKEEIEFSFEVASVRDFTLRLKAKIVDIDLLDKIDWTKCTLAEININNPVELIGKLRGAFAQLDIPDGYNLKDNIRDDIEFIFGPPGTGKTTYLSKYITRLIDENANCKILVLAPTNKACDVLTTKVMSTASCDSWLRRFVACGDQSIANQGLLCDRDSGIYNKTQCCVVSTIARLPYDGFDNPRIGLRDIEWDYVIIDEASMIPIAQIVYAIYKFADAKVIIAGDPFQISPIVREDAWVDENIYTMVNLNSFTNPSTEPHKFKIINLDTQYRSLPAIGTLFSEYAYNGMLKHYRYGEKPCDLVLDGMDITAVNFVPFRVEKYDSIYGPRKLSGSNVQIYSVLLTVEFVKYVSKQWYEKHEPEEFLRIGVICPYAAQAQLIDTMLQQRREVYPNIDVVSGTIHGFQGDECDIIITVFNTPKGLKGAPDKIFLNRKNILNVAISRARDYLFVLIPHIDTDGYENLQEIQSIGYIANKKCRTDLSIINADLVEGIIFKDSAFIEKNTFVTSHQMANVYTDAQKLYEVRIDENAVDIQINAEFE